MFALFCGVLEMNWTEYGRSGDDHYIYTAINHLFVCIQADETFISRYINSFLIF